MRSYYFSVLRSNLGSEKTYKTQITWNTQPGGLLDVCLNNLESHSALEPLCYTYTSELHRAFKALNIATLSELEKEPRSYKKSDVLRILRSVFVDVDKNNTTLPSRQKLFSAITTLFKYSGLDFINGEYWSLFAENAMRFRRAPKIKRVIALDELATEPFSQYVENPQRASEILGKTYTLIEEGCRNEIKEFSALISAQERIRTRCISRSKTKSLQIWLSKHQMAKGPHLPTGIANEEAISFLLNEWERRAFSSEEVRYAPVLKRLTDPALPTYQYRRSDSPWLLARHKLPNSVLFACFLLLLLRTGWNPDGVGALRKGDIRSQDDGGVVLQSYKGRTDDFTPPVQIDKNDSLALTCLKHLLTNLEGNKRLKFVPELEDRLWIGWHIGESQQIDAAGCVLDTFIKKYKLKRFRLSDLRPLRASMTYANSRDLEEVRILLGHKDLQTVDTYLKTTYIFKMNESNILSFQKQVLEKLLDEEETQENLTPVGDGGACVDSSRARFGTGRIPCDGLSCHVGETCKNYSIAPSRESVSNALKTLNYYEDHWESLFEANPQLTYKIHYPRILYIRVFLKAVFDARPDLFPKDRY